MLGKITVDVGIAVATTASEFSNANKAFGKSDDVIKITDDLPAGANKIDDVVIEGGANFYVGPNGKALPSQFKDWIGTNMQSTLLSQAENPQLKNAIEQLYRGKSFIGDGGTAIVVQFEKETGLMLGKNGGSHIQKAVDMASYIENKILTQQLSSSDKELAAKLLAI